MKFLRYLLPIVVASCGFTTLPLFADSRALNNRDYEAVHEYLNSKRTMDLQEKSNNLTISGDIRSEWRHLTEKENGRRLRGGDPSDTLVDGVPQSRNEFDAIFNLYFDYVCDRAWGVVWLNYDNPAGTERNLSSACQIDPQACGGSGLCGDLCLEKAYMGYNVCCDGDSRFDVELGRRPLWTVFDSRIQFLSRFDGLLLKYSTGFECWGDFYINGGGYVIDENVNHFGYVVETGLLNIADSGFDFKYSYINWPKNGTNRCLVRNPEGFKFRNSQFTFAYNFNPELLCTPAKIYGAVLYNHDARRREDTDEHKKGLGWYVGFIIGEVFQEGDWSFDMNYQFVGAHAVNDCDMSGIGRGNVLGQTFPATGNGNGNYKGWYFEGLYALTDNLTLDATLEFSRAADNNIGGRHTYSKFELEAIYAF